MGHLRKLVNHGQVGGVAKRLWETSNEVSRNVGPWSLRNRKKAVQWGPVIFVQGADRAGDHKFVDIPWLKATRNIVAEEPWYRQSLGGTICGSCGTIGGPESKRILG